jgi:hypothetical protein
MQEYLQTILGEESMNDDALEQLLTDESFGDPWSDET